MVPFVPEAGQIFRDGLPGLGDFPLRLGQRFAAARRETFRIGGGSMRCPMRSAPRFSKMVSVGISGEISPPLKFW